MFQGGWQAILFATGPGVTLVSLSFCRHDTSEIASSCVNVSNASMPWRGLPEAFVSGRFQGKFRVITRPHVFVMGRGSFNQVGFVNGGPPC